DAAGICSDGVELIDCPPPLRMTPNASCAELDPPCGTPTGACCHGDGSCAITAEQSCAGYWAGQDATCDQCPCVIPVPPGGTLEGEPDCSQDYVDFTNAGCSGLVQSFGAIAPGDVIYGTSGTYFAFDSYFRDTDVYAFTADASHAYTFTVDAEFPVQAIIFAAGVEPFPCNGRTIIAAGAADACAPLTLQTPCLGPGTYWFFVSPTDFTGVACGSRYTATLTADDCSLPLGACCVGGGSCSADVSADTCANWGSVWMGEGSSCNPNPCAPCQTDHVLNARTDQPVSAMGDTCGAGNDCPFRPSEEETWQVTIPVDGHWRFETCGAEWDTYMFLSTGCCAGILAENDDACGLRSVIDMPNLAAGTYYVTVEAYGSACGAYPLTVRYAPSCPSPFECPPGATPEGEPSCQGNANGGCNYTPVVFTPLSPGETICGTAGTYIFNGSNLRDTDWFEVTVDEAVRFTLSAEGTFPMTMGMLEQVEPGVPGCGNLAGPLVPYAEGSACVPLTFTSDCMPAGTYYFFFSPGVLAGVDCNAPYSVTLQTESCPTGACCSGVGGCTVIPEHFCTDPGAQYMGDGVSCDPNPCVTGACCTASGGCTDMSEGLCAATKGSYRGDGVACSSSPCPPTPPIPDACAEAQCLDDGFMIVNDSTAATGSDLSSCAYNDFKDVWYTYTPRQDGPVEVNTFGSVMDTTLAVFTQCPTTAGEFEVACNDTNAVQVPFDEAQVTFSALAGQTYYIRVSGLDAAAGGYNVVANGGRGVCLLGDFDHDGDVDLDDLAGFDGVLGGPDVLTPPSGSIPEYFERADFDLDGDVDLVDFARFEAAFHGSGN
ncbi:MAG TPA: hypothetical protein P5572_15505, partial [Phycisphaerae bacterium]|nr:hypothetical protein [Phycisphaerae bacterium]